MNAVTILGCLNGKLEQSRKDNIVNCLIPEMKPLRKIPGESTELFGKDIMTTVKELKKNPGNFIVQTQQPSTLMRPRQQNRYKPYSSSTYTPSTPGKIETTL